MYLARACQQFSQNDDANKVPYTRKLEIDAYAINYLSNLREKMSNNCIIISYPR